MSNPLFTDAEMLEISQWMTLHTNVPRNSSNQPCFIVGRSRSRKKKRAIKRAMAHKEEGVVKVFGTNEITSELMSDEVADEGVHPGDVDTHSTHGEPDSRDAGGSGVGHPGGAP
eukprot:jgi/Mesvir1/620/Mv26130-RA.1